jgi:AraC family transcriptional regulator of arabinose operon
VFVPGPLVEAARRRKPLLRDLLAVGAGYSARAAGPIHRPPAGGDRLVLCYCVAGVGWCEVGGRRHPMRAGELAVFAPDTPHAYAAEPGAPWTIHWIHAIGQQVPEYLAGLGVNSRRPVLNVGDDLRLAVLFTEVLGCLERGFAFPDLLQASHALGHLIAVAMRHRPPGDGEAPDSPQRVARAIGYLSERLSEPLDVAALAALAGLSPAHFTALFKEQTGCAPREYLHLLRIHRASQLLRDRTLSLKAVAAMLGYQDQFHFSRKFKAFHGVSPSVFRGTQS